MSPLVPAWFISRALALTLAPVAATLGAILGVTLSIANAQAQDHIYWLVECDGGLQDAEGVIGARHAYDINGECVLWQMRQPEDGDEMQALLDMGQTAWHDKALVTIKTRGKAAWDRESGHAQESLAFEEPVMGQVTRRGTCTKDPFLADVACGAMTAAQSLAGGPHLERLLTALQDRRSFLFRNRFSVGEAQALSAAHGKKSVPPPPEPKNPPVIDGVAAAYVWIGRSEHIVRVTLRGAQPIAARLSRARELPRPIVLEDPNPGPTQRSAALRIPPSMVRRPGVLTIGFVNKHGSARVELLACLRDGSANPKGCPVRLKAGTMPPTTAAQPNPPVLPPVGRTP